VLVRLLDGGADVPEEPEPVRERMLALGAIVGDPHAFDELHDEIRTAVFNESAVEECDDVRVLKRGENLTLGTEAA
jgi:hypothetical protein